MKTHQIDIPLQLPDHDDRDCAGLLLTAVSAHKGITGAEFDTNHSTLRLSYDPDRVSLEAVAALGAKLGVALGRQFDRCTFGVGGLRCDQCALRLEREVGALPGVVRASLNPAAATLASSTTAWLFRPNRSNSTSSARAIVSPPRQRRRSGTAMASP